MVPSRVSRSLRSNCSIKRELVDRSLSTATRVKFTGSTRGAFSIKTSKADRSISPITVCLSAMAVAERGPRSNIASSPKKSLASINERTSCWPCRPAFEICTNPEPTNIRVSPCSPSRKITVSGAKSRSHAGVAFKTSTGMSANKRFWKKSGFMAAPPGPKNKRSIPARP